MPIFVLDFCIFSCWVKIFLKVIPFPVMFQNSSLVCGLSFSSPYDLFQKSSFWYFCLLRQCLLFLDNTLCENILIKVVNTGFRFAFMFKTLIHLELIFWVLGTVKMQFQNNFPDRYLPPLSHHHLFSRLLPSQCKMMHLWLHIVSICCLFLSLFSFPLVNVSISDSMPKRFNY